MVFLHVFKTFTKSSLKKSPCNRASVLSMLGFYQCVRVKADRIPRRVEYIRIYSQNKINSKHRFRDGTLTQSHPRGHLHVHMSMFTCSWSCGISCTEGMWVMSPKMSFSFLWFFFLRWGSHEQFARVGFEPVFLISASWVARIIGVSHWYLATLVFKG
jgi:hypothetical protein